MKMPKNDFFTCTIDPMPKASPLFMWAGGKSKMWDHYKNILAEFQFENYCEPFFGGGAMLLKVLIDRRPKRIVINDINQSIMRIYKSIQSDVDTFTQVMDKLQNRYMPLNKQERWDFYSDLRDEHAFDYEKWKDTPTVEYAHLYFLMKTSFNGIWRSNRNARFGTPAGLLNQTDAVYDKKNVFAWNRILQNVEIYSEDWKTCVNRVNEDNTFFFFDPPYRGGDCDTLYGDAFDDDKQIELVKWCNDLQNSHVFFSNRDLDDGFFEKIQGSLKMKKFPIIYTVGQKEKTDDGYKAMPATEILLYK